MNFGFLIREKTKNMIITNSCFYLACTIIQGYSTTFVEGNSMVSIVWNIDIWSFLMVKYLLTMVGYVYYIFQFHRKSLKA